MIEIVETELGTRSILLIHGGSITVTHADNGLVRISMISAHEDSDASKVSHQIPLLLNIREAMTLIEFLAVASKPGSESRIINTLP